MAQVRQLSLSTAARRFATSELGINMNKIYWDAETSSFYNSDVNKDIPTSAIEITHDNWSELLDGQARGSIKTGSDGKPYIAEFDTSQNVINEAAATREHLLSVASSKINWLQDAVELGIATEDESAELLEWRKYRVLLMRVDTSKAPYIELPTLPGELAS